MLVIRGPADFLEAPDRVAVELLQPVERHVLAAHVEAALQLRPPRSLQVQRAPAPGSLAFSVRVELQPDVVRASEREEGRVHGRVLRVVRQLLVHVPDRPLEARGAPLVLRVLRVRQSAILVVYINIFLASAALGLRFLVHVVFLRAPTGALVALLAVTLRLLLVPIRRTRSFMFFIFMFILVPSF